MFLLFQIWPSITFKKFIHFIQVVEFIGIKVVQIFRIYPFSVCRTSFMIDAGYSGLLFLFSGQFNQSFTDFLRDLAFCFSFLADLISLCSSHSHYTPASWVSVLSLQHIRQAFHWLYLAWARYNLWDLDHAGVYLTNHTLEVPAMSCLIN